MLFFNSGRGPTLRRSRRSPSTWFSSSPSIDPESAMKDAGAALRHAGEDIADAARQIGTDASHQIRRNASALVANASAVPDELIPASRDAIRKSVEKLVPARKKRARGPLFSVLAVLAVTALALLGMQMLMTRRASLSTRRKPWARNPEAPAGAIAMADLPDSLGMAGTTRTVGASGMPGSGGNSTAGFSAAATTGLSKPMSLAKPVGTSSLSGAEGRHPSAELPPEATAEAATFDRDAGIRAAGEGMETSAPLGPGSSPSEIADGT